MNTNKILVVVAHPDDEILGAGATLVKHVEAGDAVYCLILGEGAMARVGASQKKLQNLKLQATEAGRVVGFKKIFFSGFPDNQFDSLPLLQISKEVEKYLAEIKPDIVYTHFDGDLNIDHQLTCRAVLTACRPCNGNSPCEIYAFETLSSTEWQSKNKKQFNPTVYVDVEEVMNKKIEAFEKYNSEMRPYPHPRSPEGIKILAQYRGLESGLRLAEAFCLLRKIIK